MPDTVVTTSPVGAPAVPGSVIEITMANSERRNALGAQMLDELAAGLYAAAGGRGPGRDHSGGAGGLDLVRRL